MEKTVERIRQFNRFYMPRMNLLGEHYLGSEYSVTPARVFFEIYRKEGCTAAQIAKTMNIDKSYLSRILKRHEKDGYLRRERAKEDGRALRIYLTESGREKAEEFIRKSNAEISGIIEGLSEEDQEELIRALDRVTEILERRSKK